MQSYNYLFIDMWPQCQNLKILVFRYLALVHRAWILEHSLEDDGPELHELQSRKQVCRS
jgi:hypothetical protein